MKSRSQKLKELKEQQVANNMVIVSNGEPFIEALQDKITELKKTLGLGVEFNNIDQLVEKLGTLEATASAVTELRESIRELKFPDMPTSVDINNIDKLVDAITDLNKIKAPEINLEPLQDVIKSIESLTKVVQENKAVPQGQRPEDYIPMRRVMLVGKTFMYDDSFYTGGGGGGGSQAAPTILFQPIAQGGAGTTAIAGGVAGKRIKVTSYVVVGGGTGTFKFQGDSNDLTGAMPFVANSGVATSGTEFSALFQTGVGETLNLTTTGAAGQGHISYYFE